MNVNYSTTHGPPTDNSGVNATSPVWHAPSPPTDNSGGDTTSHGRHALSTPTDNSRADATSPVWHTPSPPAVNSGNIMTTWNYTATSVANMLAVFPAKTITRINGKPTIHSLLGALKVLCRCNQKLPSTLGSRGYLFIALPIDHYQRFTNVPLNLPGPTPELPRFTEKMDATQREQAKLQWQAHKCENDNIKNMNEALLNMFLEGTDPDYKRHLDNNFVGAINSNFWNVFNGFLTKYGKFKPLDMEANTVRMKKRYEAADPI